MGFNQKAIGDIFQLLMSIIKIILRSFPDKSHHKDPGLSQKIIIH